MTIQNCIDWSGTDKLIIHSRRCCKINKFNECDIYEDIIDDHLMSIYSILYSAADMSLEGC